MAVNAGAADAYGPVFDITFEGDLSKQDIDNITVYFGNLDGARVKPTNVQQGREQQGQVQKITLTNANAQTRFALSAGATTVDGLSLQSSRDEIQEAVTQLAQSINASGTATVVLWTGSELAVEFGGA